MEYTWEKNEKSLEAPSPWPERVFIELTTRCNMACKFCPSPVLKRARQDIDPEIVKKVLRELKEKNSLVTFHLMGEPLLNKNFFEYAALCDEYGIKYWLVSNGLLFTEEIVEKLFSLENLQNLEVSFHTCHPDAWPLRGVKTSFEEYLKRVGIAVFSTQRYIRNIPLNIDIMYDAHLGNLGWKAFSKERWQQFAIIAQKWRGELIQKFPDMQDIYPRFFNGKKKKFQKGSLVWWRNLEDMPENFFEDMSPEKMWFAWEIFPQIFITFKKFFFFGKDQDYINHALGTDQKISIEPAINFRCDWNRDLAILADGTITFCCMDYEGKLGCGNINKMSLEEACASRHRKTLLEKPSDFEFCRNCMGNLISG